MNLGGSGGHLGATFGRFLGALGGPRGAPWGLRRASGGHEEPVLSPFWGNCGGAFYWDPEQTGKSMFLQVRDMPEV